jgi:hypothetical protein
VQILEDVEEAKRKAIPIIDRPLRPGAMTITDGIIYRRVAAELGRFPPAIVGELVGFYTRAIEIARIASLSTSGLGGFTVVKELAPRVRIHGAMLLARLEKFERSGYSTDADTAPTREELMAMARAVEYPVEDIARDRGFKL